MNEHQTGPVRRQEPVNSRSVDELFAVVANAVGGIDLTHDIPMGLVPDVDEAIRPLELFLEVLIPLIGEESFLHLCNQDRVQVVCVSVARGREGLGLVDRAQFALVDDAAASAMRKSTELAIAAIS